MKGSNGGEQPEPGMRPEGQQRFLFLIKSYPPVYTDLPGMIHSLIF